VAERAHLPRAIFLGLLRRVRVLVGNSSAGLIEASAVPLRVINIGRRQAGRERAGNVIEVVDPTGSELAAALHTALASPPPRSTPPYGDGRTGPLVAELLAGEGLRRARIAKRNTY
jgi:UDP-N-acetylglucosamine 2-epimerase